MRGLLFTYGLTMVGAVISLSAPWYGLLIYICFSTLRPDTLWFWSVAPGPYTRIVAISVLLGWAGQGFGNWNVGAARWPMYCIIGFWIWILLSGLFAPYPQVAWAYADLFSRILLPLVVGYTLMDSQEKVRQLCWVLVLSIGFVGYEANLDYLQGGTRLMTYGYFGVDNNSACIGLITGAGLAFFLGIAEKVWYRKLLCFAIAAMLVHAPMFGDSRGGMMGVAATGIAAFVVMPKRPKYFLLYGLAVFLALELAGDHVRERFLSSFVSREELDGSAASRLVMWEQCWDAMQRFPLFGVGPNHWPLAAQEMYGWTHGLRAHNLWLEIGASLGFPGLFFLAGFYGLTSIFLWWRWFFKRFPDEWSDHVARGLIVSLSGFAVSAMFVSLDAMEPPYFVALLGGGLIRWADAPEVECEEEEETAPLAEWETAGSFA